jgi:hypothetical protein
LPKPTCTPARLLLLLMPPLPNRTNPERKWYLRLFAPGQAFWGCISWIAWMAVGIGDGKERPDEFTARVLQNTLP